MGDNLCQDGLSFVPKGIVGRLISVRRKLEWFLELPLEVQRQAHWNLITCESERSIVVRRKEDLRVSSPRTYPSLASRIDFRQVCRVHVV